MATRDSDSNLPELVIYQSTGDWAALYVDGYLESVDDRQTLEQSALSILGVRTVSSDDFLQGGNSREDVAYSLSEIEEYRQLRESREAEPQILEREADGFEEQSRIFEERAALLRQAAAQSRAAGKLSSEALKLVGDLRKSLDR